MRLSLAAIAGTLLNNVIPGCHHPGWSSQHGAVLVSDHPCECGFDTPSVTTMEGRCAASELGMSAHSCRCQVAPVDVFGALAPATSSCTCVNTACFTSHLSGTGDLWQSLSHGGGLNCTPAPAPDSLLGLYRCSFTNIDGSGVLGDPHSQRSLALPPRDCFSLQQHCSQNLSAQVEN